MPHSFSFRDSPVIALSFSFFLSSGMSRPLPLFFSLFLIIITQVVGAARGLHNESSTHATVSSFLRAANEAERGLVDSAADAKCFMASLGRDDLARVSHLSKLVDSKLAWVSREDSELGGGGASLLEGGGGFVGGRSAEALRTGKLADELRAAKGQVQAALSQARFELDDSTYLWRKQQRQQQRQQQGGSSGDAGVTGERGAAEDTREGGDDDEYDDDDDDDDDDEFADEYDGGDDDDEDSFGAQEQHDGGDFVIAPRKTTNGGGGKGKGSGGEGKGKGGKGGRGGKGNRGKSHSDGAGGGGGAPSSDASAADEDGGKWQTVKKKDNSQKRRRGGLVQKQRR